MDERARASRRRLKRRFTVFAGGPLETLIAVGIVSDDTFMSEIKVLATMESAAEDGGVGRGGSAPRRRECIARGGERTTTSESAK